MFLHSKVRTGENLSDTFPIQNGMKQGDASWTMIFNFALVYSVSKSFRICRLEQELQMLQLSAAMCTCIAIL
jgi:hypothetical protein